MSHQSTKGLRVSLLGAGGQKLEGATGLHSPCPVCISVVAIYIGMHMLREKLGRYFKCVFLLLSWLRHTPCIYATTVCLFGVLSWTVHITAISWPFPCPISSLSAGFAAHSEDCILLSVLWFTPRSLRSLRLGLLKLTGLVHYLFCSNAQRHLFCRAASVSGTHAAVCPKVRDTFS